MKARGERAGGGKGESRGGVESREGERKAGEACHKGGQGEVSAKYCLKFGMESVHVMS